MFFKTETIDENGNLIDKESGLFINYILSYQQTKEINLLPFSNNDYYYGRSLGFMARKSLNLDGKDKDEFIYHLNIGQNCTAFNPSFFKAMFLTSFKNLGENNFSKKYIFLTDNIIHSDKINLQIKVGLRQIKNELKSFTLYDHICDMLRKIKIE